METQVGVQDDSGYISSPTNSPAASPEVFGPHAPHQPPFSLPAYPFSPGATSWYSLYPQVPAEAGLQALVDDAVSKSHEYAMESLFRDMQLPDFMVEDVSAAIEANIHTIARLRVRAFEQDLQLTRAVAAAFKKTQILNALPVLDDSTRKLAVEIAARQLQHLKLQYAIIRQVEPSQSDAGLEGLDHIIQELHRRMDAIQALIDDFMKALIAFSQLSPGTGQTNLVQCLVARDVMVRRELIEVTATIAEISAKPHFLRN